MKNLDKAKFAQAYDTMNKGISEGSNELFTEGLDLFAAEIEQNIKADFNASTDRSIDELISDKKYNLRKLSPETEKFYRAVTVNGNTFQNTELPKDVFDKVFEDLRAEHPLLSEIQFVNTQGVSEWVFRNSEVASAQWGKICDEIKKQLDAAFKKETLTPNKLSAFVNMCKSMLALGPVWLDRFIREILLESISIGTEQAVVAGTGVDMPVGILKNMTTFTEGTGYPDKSAVSLTSLDDNAISEKIMAPLTKDGTKVVNPGDMLFIINPLDYWTKVRKALAYRDLNGNIIVDRTSIGAKLIQSVFMPKGKMAVGKAKDYFMGIAMATKVEYSDEYRFLEDDRVYVVKMIGSGKPINNDAFQVFDISGVTSPTV